MGERPSATDCVLESFSCRSRFTNRCSDSSSLKGRKKVVAWEVGQER